jgi:hypothetical protein
MGRARATPIPGSHPNIFTPDDLMTGKMPQGRVVIYDDDHYYMGGVLAELLAQNGTAAIWDKAVFYHFIHTVMLYVLAQRQRLKAG